MFWAVCIHACVKSVSELNPQVCVCLKMKMCVVTWKFQEVMLTELKPVTEKRKNVARAYHRFT